MIATSFPSFVDADARARGAKLTVRFTAAIDGPAAPRGNGDRPRPRQGHLAGLADFGLPTSTPACSIAPSACGARTTAAASIDPHWRPSWRGGWRPRISMRDDLRSARAGEAAAEVAALPAVRAALLDFQRGFARREGGAVLDGRDIGTVIAPEAAAKLFVTASARARRAPAGRARRRRASTRSSPTSATATPATPAATSPRWRRPRTRSCSTPPI